MKTRDFLIALFISMVSYNQAWGESPTWQSILESHFDRVDTFDHYNDWRPTNTTCGGSMNVIDLPNYTDGGPKGIQIGAYDFPSELPDDQRPLSIAAWGSPYVARGTGKSMVVGYAGIPAKDACPNWYGTDTYTGHRGPNWVKIYFGDRSNTDGTSGYLEPYIFMRVYMPSSQIPTDQQIPNTKIYKYLKGNEYLDNSSVGNKIVAFLSGFVSAHEYHSPAGDVAGISRYSPDDEIINTLINPIFRYGDAENWIYMRAYRTEITSGPRIDLGAQFTIRELTRNYMQDTPEGRRNAWNHPTYGIMDQLGAIEFHLKMSTTNESDDGILQVWFYDASGNATQIINNNNISYYRWLVHATAGHRFNNLQINGNSRVYHDCGTPCSSNQDVYFSCGEGMECGWWLDDLIVDDQRIGIKYFELLNPPVKPAGLKLE